METNQATSNVNELAEGQVRIFRNAQRKPESKEPEYWGKTMIDGKERRISLWVNESANGNKYFQGRIQEYKPVEATAQVVSDDLPF